MAEPTAEPLSVVLVDDSENIRLLVRMTLEDGDGFVVVGEAGDGAAGVEAITSMQPDVALLDIQMPVMDGLQTLAKLREATTRTTIVMLTSWSAGGRVSRAALDLGAAGYIDKSAPISQLPDELRRILAERDATDADPARG